MYYQYAQARINERLAEAEARRQAKQARGQQPGLGQKAREKISGLFENKGAELKAAEAPGG